MLIQKVFKILRDIIPKIDEIHKVRIDNKTNTVLVDVNLGKVVTIIENDNKLVIRGGLKECELIKKILEKML